jgi:hypothetical protein
MNLNPLKLHSLEKIVLKNSLKTHYSFHGLIDLIVKQVKEIPEYGKLKQDTELILVVCHMIEGITLDSNVKVNKLETAVAIYTALFEMTADEQIMLVNIVGFLHENNAFLIKRGVFKNVSKALCWLASKGVAVGLNFVH